MSDLGNLFDTEELDGFDAEEMAEVNALFEFLEMLPRTGVAVLDPVRAQQMQFAYLQIKKVLREAECNAKIECKQHELNPHVGVLRIEGVSLDMRDAEGFARVAEFASNTEVYPLKDNKVRMTFTFNGLLKRID